VLQGNAICYGTPYFYPIFRGVLKEERYAMTKKQFNYRVQQITPLNPLSV